MAVSHALWEAKFLKYVARLLPLHRNRVVALDWIVLLSLLVEGDFTHDSRSELREN